jgi:hypothetical protein
VNFKFSRRTWVALPALLGVCCVSLAIIWLNNGTQSQRLDDGSILALNRVEYGSTNEFSHGKQWEKLLGDLIPTNGIQIAKFKAERPTKVRFFMAGQPWLSIEFKVIPHSRHGTPLLARSDFYRQFRCIVSGETGIEFVEEFLGDGFKNYRDGYFDYILSSRFPRDSKRLNFRIEQQKEQAGSWRTIANFRIKNPARDAKLPWTAEPAPITKVANGMEFVLGHVTMESRPFSEKDIWNHRFDIPFQVRANGVALTNWSTAQVEADDASGNWGVNSMPQGFTNGWSLVRGWRGLDPRFVWRLQVDFAPAFQFRPESLFQFSVPVSLATPILTNAADIPLKISWVNQHMLSVQMLTNREDLRLLFVAAKDSQGRNLNDFSGSWGQAGFWHSVKFDGTNRSVEATVAVVPNVKVTFYVQPKLVVDAAHSSASP